MLLKQPQLAAMQVIGIPHGLRSPQQTSRSTFMFPFLVQIVFNNAGVMRWASIESANEEDMIYCYRVNCMAHIFVVQALLEHNLLESGSLIANITSLVCATVP
jgi:NAD(P)-dependent dehydrogenase (short-subunit alcohol dehydrogenase family)